MRQELARWTKLALFMLTLVAIDYYSKDLVAGYLEHTKGYVKDVTSFFGLVHSWNYGISFGLFSHYYQYSNLVFMVLNFLIVMYLCFLLHHSSTVASLAGYSLIIGGALGNLLDRVVNGAVFDFLYFHLWQYHFPVFNLADVFISLGVVVLIYDMACSSNK